MNTLAIILIILFLAFIAAASYSLNAEILYYLKRRDERRKK